MGESDGDDGSWDLIHRGECSEPLPTRRSDAAELRELGRKEASLEDSVTQFVISDLDVDLQWEKLASSIADASPSEDSKTRRRSTRKWISVISPFLMQFRSLANARPPTDSDAATSDGSPPARPSSSAEKWTSHSLINRGSLAGSAVASSDKDDSSSDGLPPDGLPPDGLPPVRRNEPNSELPSQTIARRNRFRRVHFIYKGEVKEVKLRTTQLSSLKYLERLVKLNIDDLRSWLERGAAWRQHTLAIVVTHRDSRGRQVELRSDTQLRNVIGGCDPNEALVFTVSTRPYGGTNAGPRPDTALQIPIKLNIPCRYVKTPGGCIYGQRCRFFHAIA